MPLPWQAKSSNPLEACSFAGSLITISLLVPASYAGLPFVELACTKSPIERGLAGSYAESSESSLGALTFELNFSIINHEGPVPSVHFINRERRAWERMARSGHCGFSSRKRGLPHEEDRARSGPKRPAPLETEEMGAVLFVAL